MITAKPFNKKSGAGFTLIETLVYIALFAILMGGAVAVAYTVFESVGHNQAKQILQQEGDFLIGKIEWALSGAQTITVPRLDTLQITKYGSSDITTISVLENCSGPAITTNIFLMEDISCSQLNNSNVQIKDLKFIYTAASGEGINPESVSASFVLTTRAENGMLINQNFSTTKYLRK
jgi:type II secretory pathway pseudopilin PulG